MRSPHILRIGTNIRKVKQNLVDVVDAAALDSIELAIHRNVAQLFGLGKDHYNFAVRQNNRAWRQKVSRLYYAAYNASRAVRLCVEGEYSEDSSDHKKIDQLPKDFPERNTYVTELTTLREDRNTCDYDHTAVLADLILGIDRTVEIVTKFLDATTAYLKSRGITL